MKMKVKRKLDAKYDMYYKIMKFIFIKK